MRQNYASIMSYRNLFREEMQKAGIDALLCPAQVMPAPAHIVPLSLSAACSYTAIFNLLDFSAGVIPVDRWTLGC